MLVFGNPARPQDQQDFHKWKGTAILYVSSTYTWGIPKSFDALEDSSTDSSHGEGSTTIINNSPGAENTWQIIIVLKFRRQSKVWETVKFVVNREVPTLL